MVEIDYICPMCDSTNFGWGLGWFWMLLFWIIIIVVIILLISALIGPSKRTSKVHRKIYHSEDPHLILNKRYAKGEITKKEYESMKKEIRRK